MDGGLHVHDHSGDVGESEQCANAKCALRMILREGEMRRAEICQSSH
jgi:hypothetical protein